MWSFVSAILMILTIVQGILLHMCTYNFIIYYITSVIIAMLNTISRAKYIMVIRSSVNKQNLILCYMTIFFNEILSKYEKKSGTTL